MKNVWVMVAMVFVLAATGYAEDVYLIQNGNLSVGDTQLPDGRLIDWFSVPVPEGVRVRTRAVSVDFDPVLLSDSSDTQREQAGRSGGVEVITMADSGTLRIGVTSHRGAPVNGGRYMLKISSVPAPPPLAAGSVFQGELSDGDQTTQDGRAVDWYTLSVLQGERLLVAARTDEFDSHLTLLRPDGTKIENDDFQGTSAGIVYTAPRDQSVQVGVSSYESGESGYYTISVHALSAPRSIEVGQTVTGALSAEQSQIGFDAYRVSASAGSMIIVRVESAAFDPMLSMEGEDGFIAENDDAPDGSSNSELFYTFPRSGSLEIRVNQYIEDEPAFGEYRLSVNEYIPSGELRSVTDGEFLLPGEHFQAILGPSAPLSEGRFEQHYRLRIPAERHVTLDIGSMYFDSYLTLLTPGGDKLEDDDSGGGAHARLDFVADEGGVYDLYVSTYGRGEAGPYTLTYELGGEVTLLSSEEADLEAGAPTDPDGIPYAAHTLELQSGTTYLLDVSSSAFDPLISLFDPAGTVVAENDDYGSTTAARVVFTPEITGRYTLHVKSYYPEEHGAYLLTLRSE